MNFFSHAAVAGRFSSDAAFVFGAMLPDFGAMLGRRWGAPVHPELDPGIRFHHLTDSAFHELRDFRDMCRDATLELRERGMARGPARAAAHVAVELLLDAWLARSQSACNAYLDALAAGTRSRLLAPLASDDGDQARLRDFLRTLIERGATSDAPSPPLVERVRRILSRRPRLALAPGDDARLLDWLEGARTAIVASSPALVAELTSELDRRLPV